MKTNHVSRLLIALAGAMLVPPAVPSSAAEPARKPNVIIILADDLGYADIGCHGCKDIPTPHIDSIAKAGVRCTNGYVSHPFCSPTRAGLMTGRYQQRFGHENNPAYLPEDATVGLPVDQATIADAMKSAGYVTGAVGKWHLGAAPRFHPIRRGFDEYFGLIGGGHNYFEHNLFKTGSAKSKAEYFIPLQRQTEPVEENEYLTDALSREAVAFIERHWEKPFFLYLAYNAPHTPLQAPEKHLERVKHITDEKRRTYAAMICAMDDGIGRVLATLRERKLEENTLVVFLSDNGGPTAVTNSRNDPLRGAKGQVYEGGIRVPFLLRWPAALKSGTTFDHPVMCIDLLPTATAVTATKTHQQVKLDGVNLLPYLRGEAKGAPHETLFWRMGGGVSYAVRQGSLKLVRPPDGKPQLFDLGKDVGETKDLAGEQPARLAQLQEVYDTWNQELSAPRWQNPQGMKAKPPAKP